MGLKLKEVLSDQPGRVLAVFVFAPILLYKAVIYKDVFIAVFAALLFVWDLFWLLFRDPKRTTIDVGDSTQFEEWSATLHSVLTTILQSSTPLVKL